jgi:hypothetical protein
MIIVFPVAIQPYREFDDVGLRQGWGRMMQQSEHFHARQRRITALLSK